MLQALLFCGLLALEAGAAVDASPPAGNTIGPAGSSPHWVFFSDRAAWSPAERQAMLAELERTIDPHTLARRAKVMDAPLLREFDLPVCPAYVEQVLERGAVLRQESRWLNAVSVEGTPAVLEAVGELPFVRATQPVARGLRREPVQLEPVEPPPGQSRLDYGSSYAQLEQIGVIGAHDQGLSGAGVRVLMLDTGYYKDHESIHEDQILDEWDFINDDGDTQNEAGDPSGQHDHGTMTLSSLGGSSSGNLYGPAYGADFLLAKTEDVSSETPVEEDYYVAGLEWGEILGADVASASLGYLDWYTWPDMDGLTAVTTIGVNTAVSLGVSVANAAGNERGTAWDHIIAPADAFEVIAVGAVDSGGSLAYFSSPGPTYDGRIKPEVVARGVSTACASPYGASSYTTASGTSLATPLVGGCAALLLEADPSLTPTELRQLMTSTADNADTPDNDYGWGLVDMTAALEALRAFEALDPVVLGDDDGDGVAEPGETVELEIPLHNLDGQAYTTVTGLLSSPSEWIDVQQASASYPSFAPDETHGNLTAYVIQVLEGAPAVFSAGLDLEVDADGHVEQVSQTLQVGALEVYYSHDAESGEEGWTHSAAGGWNDQWHLSVEDAASPVTSWKCGDTGSGDYAAELDARLVSPGLEIRPWTRLRFQHRIEAEASGAYPDSAYDGGILELSDDGGQSWQQLQPESGPYGHNLRWESGGGNPATHPFDGGTACWSGDFDWQESVVDLVAWDGQTVQLRFRFGSDTGGNLEGWYVDDILLEGLAGGPPDPVTDLSISLLNQDEVQLSWSPSAGAAQYRVESRVDLSDAWVTETVQAETSLVLPVQPGSRLFRVIAENQNYTSGSCSL